MHVKRQRFLQAEGKTGAGRPRGVARAARAATAGLLAVSMGFALMVPSPAIAEGDATADAASAVQINNAEGNSTSYVGYRIFSADVRAGAEDGADKVASNIDWASDQVKDVVTQAIAEADANYKGTTAQEAAVWMEENVAGFHTGTDDSGAAVTAQTQGASASRTYVDRNSFAYTLATKLADSGAGVDVAAGSEQALDEGWWLFLTKPDSLGTEGKSTMATAPIYTLVGVGTTVVNEKTKLPTLQKALKDANDVTELHTADQGGTGSLTLYRLTGTLPGNIGEFSTYSYTFTDMPSEGLTIDLDSVKVKMYDNMKDATFNDLVGINDRTYPNVVTDKFDIHMDGNKLVVSCDDILKLGDVTPNTVITVNYHAHLNGKAVTGGEGNTNVAELTYPNDPHSGGVGKVTSNQVSLYTYRLNLKKVDRNTEQDLKGAKFTIQLFREHETSIDYPYVQADGSLVNDKPYEFTTDDQGNISVGGLTEGLYIITETQAPDGYDPIETFMVDVTAKWSDDGQTLTSMGGELLEADTGHKLSDTRAVLGLPDGTPGDHVLTGKAGTEVKLDDASVTVSVGDDRVSTLPLTGEQGIGVAVAVGSAGVVLSLAGMMTRRRKQTQSVG